MRIINPFAGMGTWSRPWQDRGHTAWKTDIVDYPGIDLVTDVLDLRLSDIPEGGDVFLASPDCTAFSVASIGTHWGGGVRGYVPKTTKAHNRMALVHQAIAMAEALVARDGLQWGVVENPRGVLRKLGILNRVDDDGEVVTDGGRYPLATVSYCRYGDIRMKPTDLWGVPAFPPGWEPRPMCHNGNPDHEAAPRGAKTGTQGLDKVERSFMPYELSLELCLAAEEGTKRLGHRPFLYKASPEGFVYYRSLVPADQQHFLTPYTVDTIREQGWQPYLWTGAGRTACGFLLGTDGTLSNVFNVGAYKGAGSDAVQYAVDWLGARRVAFFDHPYLRELYGEHFVLNQRVPFDLETIRRDFPDYDPDVSGTPALWVGERR